MTKKYLPGVVYHMPELQIEFDTSAGSSVLGRLWRLLTFPVKWVLFGKATL